MLAAAAIAIVSGTIFYSNYLAKKIASEEKRKIEQWVAAFIDINNPNTVETNLSVKILTENSRDIPMIAVTEKDSILDHYNLDSQKIASDSTYLLRKLQEFKQEHKPIGWKNPLNTSQSNLVYYGESSLLKQIRYFPIIQLIIVAFFIIITLFAISSRHKSTQNQVWAGMAKETAHQLGTPISSLQGWIEILKDKPDSTAIAEEMFKDVNRLKLISDRFGKIGSTPSLETHNIEQQVETMVSYIKRRASQKVNFIVKTIGEKPVITAISAPLFDWVIENLLKNALDSMESEGTISVFIRNESKQVIIDIQDTGKGISKKNIPKVFKPGFTTKKRGWGLGLSLSKRIIDQYHKGHLFIKHSEYNKGTTFRIVLNK